MSLLPTAKNTPQLAFDTQVKVVHGMPKVGKSELANGAPDAVFFSTEGRCNHLTSAVVEVTSWEQFTGLCKEVVVSQYKTVVIDVIANLWPMAEIAYCKEKGIKSMLDEQYPPGPQIVETRILNALIHLSRAKTLLLIAHTQFDGEPVPGPNGTVVLKKRWMPVCAPGGRPDERVHNAIQKICYMELFMEMQGDKRVVHPNPHSGWEAGVTLPAGAGKMPNDIIIPDGSNGYQLVKEAYEAALRKQLVQA